MHKFRVVDYVQVREWVNLEITSAFKIIYTRDKMFISEYEEYTRLHSLWGLFISCQGEEFFHVILARAYVNILGDKDWYYISDCGSV